MSLALSKQISYVDKVIDDKNIEIATCKELVDEITQVSQRPKFRKYFPLAYSKELVSYHKFISRLFELNYIPDIVIDKKDNYLLRYVNC